MNKNLLMIGGGALLISILVGMIVQATLTPKKVPEQAKTGTEILVASRQILIGQKLTAEDIRWQAFPDEAVFKGAIKKSDQADPAKLSYYGSPLRRDVESGEPITLQALISDTKGVFLSAIIAPGMRAMSVGVKDYTSAGGFIAPGDHVDVLLAYTAKLTGATQDYAPSIVQRVASQLVLSNVKVLGVDQNSKDDAHEAKVAKTVTLEVTQEGAQKIALAQQMGDISLSLRRLGEKDDPDAPPPALVTDVTATDVIKKINADMEAAKANKQISTVRVYGGDNIMNIPVRPASSDK